MSGKRLSLPSRASWLTPRTLSRRTYGGVVADIAARLGRPLMPAQRYVVDVALEVDSRGRWCYPQVVKLAPRRAGKTTLLMPVISRTCETKQHARAILTAQRGGDAADIFTELTDALLATPGAGDRYRRVTTKSAERLRFVKTGSVLQPFAPGPKAGHSKTVDLAIVDEAWAFTVDQVKAMRAGYRPAMLTTGGQEWIVSTAGTWASTFLNELREEGRADVEAGRTSGRAFFDYTMPETIEGVELAELDTETLLAAIADHHPAAGYIFERGDLLELMRLDWKDLGGRNGVLRAYGNVTDQGTAESVLSPATWETARSDRRLPDGPAVIGIMVDPGGLSASIVAAGADPGGPVVIELLRQQSGTAWLIDACRALGPNAAVFAVNSLGAGKDVGDALERIGLSVARIPQTDLAASSARLVRGVIAGEVVHRGQHGLAAAVQAGSTRAIGGGWTWAGGSPLSAAGLAVWQLEHEPAPAEPLPTFQVFTPRRAS